MLAGPRLLRYLLVLKECTRAHTGERVSERETDASGQAKDGAGAAAAAATAAAAVAAADELGVVTCYDSVVVSAPGIGPGVWGRVVRAISANVTWTRTGEPWSEATSARLMTASLTES